MPCFTKPSPCLIQSRQWDLWLNVLLPQGPCSGLVPRMYKTVAGIYYPQGSLKARLCVEGREALYAYCEARGVPYKRIGKLMVAADESQLDDLRSYKEKGHKNGVCVTNFLTATRTGSGLASTSNWRRSRVCQYIAKVTMFNHLPWSMTGVALSPCHLQSYRLGCMVAGGPEVAGCARGQGDGAGAALRGRSLV